MNSKVTKLAETVAALHKAGIAVPESVDRALDELEEPIYKVGIVGKFQTGKSRLVNEAFLGKELLLQEGIGLCTTAVTTEVAYGEIAQLTVNYKDGSPTRVIQNPNADDIRAVTSARTSDERLKLASEIESVKLELPCEPLKKFSVFDTAGIDDPDPELLQLTTYKTIPQLDVAVMVVGAKALSQPELNFLRQSIFQCGIANVMVLVSYNAERDSLSEGGRADLIEAIHGQLEEIGRGSVPVKMVCYDPSVEDALSKREDIVAEISTFAENSAMQNRVNKLTVLVRKVLSDRIRDLKFKLSLAGKSADEIEKIRHDLAQLELELKGVRTELQDRFDGILTSIAQEESVLFRGSCDKIVDGFMANLGETEDVGEVQEKLKTVSTELVPQIENAAVSCFDTIRQRVMAEMQKINARLIGICANCNLPPFLFSSDMTVDGGICAELNSKLVTVVDYIISIMLLPGGIFMGWAIRYCLGLIPGLRKILPLSLVKLYMEHKVGNSLAEEKDRLVESFRETIGQALLSLRNDIFKALYEEVDARIKEATNAAASKMGASAPLAEEAISKELEWCRGLLNAL